MALFIFEVDGDSTQTEFWNSTYPAAAGILECAGIFEPLPAM